MLVSRDIVVVLYFYLFPQCFSSVCDVIIYFIVLFATFFQKSKPTKKNHFLTGLFLFPSLLVPFYVFMLLKSFCKLESLKTL